MSRATRRTAAASTRSRQEPSLSPPTATTMLPWVGPGQGTVRVRVKVEVRLMVRVRFRLRSSVLTLPRAMAARSWSALAEQRRSWRSAALARCSAFCSAWHAGQEAATCGGGGMVSGEPQHVCWQALCWQALCWQGKGWSGVGLMRGCHTCRSRCVSGSGCLGPLPPPVPPAPLLLPPPLPAPAPLLPLPLLPPPLPPLPRPPPAFSGEALRASGGGGGGSSRLRVVVRSLHPSQPRHLHQEPESASTPRTRDRRSREHAQGRWRGARAQC